MKKFIVPFSILILLLSGMATIHFIKQKPDSVLTSDLNKEPESHPKSLEPNDYWHQVHSYPDGFDQQQYLQQMELVKLNAEESASNRTADLTLPWLQEGPGNIGGRFNTLAMNPANQNVIYAGACNGGIFKTTNGGSTWSPIFDANAYLSIGDITIDPNNENILYVGTGDKNFGGASLLGNGVYKSVDAGTTWTQIGLEQTSIITNVIVDPSNSNRIFASTLGNTYEKTTERGVYRSTDGGASWQNILFLSDSSGVSDLKMDPSNPNILYATGFNRINLPFQSKVTGPDAKIYKTIDGGDNWIELAGGLPTTPESRIGLAISNTDPNTVYAIYVDGITLNTKEIYKTTDGGTNWNPLNIPPDVTNALGGFGWYFGQIHINPYNNNQLIVPGVEMFMSMDGGVNWVQNVPDWWTYEVHADKHDVLFLDANSYIIATDGGLYKTDDNGINWTDIENIPVTQFYHIAVDPLNIGVYGGGAQDNGTMTGNSFSFNNWERLFGGDGFRMKYLDLDLGSAYYETQYGGLYYNGMDDISMSTSGSDRVNWDMPYVINENTGDLYAGTSMIHLMEFAPWGSYVPVSGDLTKVGMGITQGSNSYHTITEIDMPLDTENKMFVGTSDGLVWRGNRSSGTWSWTNITGILPDRYVTAVRCSPNVSGTVYVAFSGYKLNEDISYLYKSTDNGTTWQDISGNLPGITVNDILIIPGGSADDLLFAALDGGVYFSENGGTQWDYVGVDMPVVTVTELDLDIPNKKLIAGTFSRSMFSYDISWIDNIVDPTTIAENQNVESVKIYPNPVVDVLNFEGLKSKTVLLYDLKGNLLLTKEISATNGYGSVDLTFLPPGVYFYRAGNSAGKFIKK